MLPTTFMLGYSICSTYMYVCVLMKLKVRETLGKVSYVHKCTLPGLPYTNKQVRVIMRGVLEQVMHTRRAS